MALLIFKKFFFKINNPTTIICSTINRVVNKPRSGETIDVIKTVVCQIIESSCFSDSICYFKNYNI